MEDKHRKLKENKIKILIKIKAALQKIIILGKTFSKPLNNKI
jgi:hypothetical protein